LKYYNTIIEYITEITDKIIGVYFTDLKVTSSYSGSIIEYLVSNSNSAPIAVLVFKSEYPIDITEDSSVITIERNYSLYLALRKVIGTDNERLFRDLRNELVTGVTINLNDGDSYVICYAGANTVHYDEQIECFEIYLKAITNV
jgi:hypothetical protein